MTDIELIVLREQVCALTVVVNELAQVMEANPDISGPWKKRVWNAIEKLQYVGMEEQIAYERNKEEFSKCPL